MSVEGHLTLGAMITFAMLGLDIFYSVGLTLFSFFFCVLPEYKVVGGGSLMDLPYNDFSAS